MNLKVKFAGLDSLLFEDLCKVNMPDRSVTTKSTGKKSIFSGADKVKNPDNVKDDLLLDLKKMDVSEVVPEEKSPSGGAADLQDPSHFSDSIQDAIVSCMLVFCSFFVDIETHLCLENYKV